MSEEEVKRLLKLVEESFNETSITVKLAKKKICELPIEVINYAINYNVDRLSIENNQLSKLPNEISNFTHLRFLNLSLNFFMEFPEALCSMPSLKILDISKNKISKLPQDFGKLMTLQLLKISKNQIKRIPNYFADMKDLQYLKIDYNPIKFPPKVIHMMPKGEDKDVMLPWLENLKEYLRQNSDQTDLDESNHSSGEEVDYQLDSQNINNNKQLKKAISVDNINYVSSNVNTRQIVDGIGSSSSLKTIKENDQMVSKQEKKRLNPKLSLDLQPVRRSRSHSNDFDATLTNFRNTFVKHSKSISTDSINSTPNQSGITEEKQSDHYFQKLRTLPPSEHLPMSDISLREASRNILYAFSQVHKAICQFAIFTGNEKIFLNDLNKATTLIGQLSTALEKYDNFALQAPPDAEYCIKLLSTCQESIASFKILVELLNKRLKSLTQSSDNLRYSRTLLLMLHGAVADIKFAWELIFPLLNVSTPYTGMSTPFRSKSMTRSNSSNLANNVVPYSASAASSYFFAIPSSPYNNLNTPTSAGSAGSPNNLNTEFLFSITIFDQLLSKVEFAIKAVENVIKYLSDNVKDVLEPTSEDQVESSSIKDKMNELIKDANEVTIHLKRSLLSVKSSTNNKDDPSIQLKVYDDTLVFLQTTIKLCEFAKEVSHKWQLSSKVKAGLSHVMKSYTELTDLLNKNQVLLDNT